MFTKRLLPYLGILRPANATLSLVGVILGFWISRAGGGGAALTLLCCAAFAATGFGNIINDIFDISTDRLSHPGRPLPSGAMTIIEARAFAAVLAALCLICGTAASPAHGMGAAIPLMILAGYARWLKRTPLAGNALISLLVAYPVLYGSLGAPDAARLYLPAMLAFLVNMCREIVKDLQDRSGDTAAGMVTSAALPGPAIRALVMLLTIVYVPAVFLPYALGQFHAAYLAVCIAAVLPLRGVWLWRYLASPAAGRLAAISLLIKLEMLAGLLALAADQAMTLN